MSPSRSAPIPTRGSNRDHGSQNRVRRANAVEMDFRSFFGAKRNARDSGSPGDNWSSR